MLGWHNGGTAGKIIALVVVFFLSALIAVLGHATMVYFQRIFAVLLSLVMVVVFFYTIGGVNWSAGPAHPLSTSATIGAFLAGTAVIASGPLSYMFNCSDWPRYLPGKTSSRSIFWNVLWSSSGIAIFLGFMGVILSSRGDMSNPVAGLQHLIPEWLFILYAIAAVGGAVANNVVTFYASGLTLQSVGVPLKRYQATMCDMTVATVLVIYVVFISSNFLTDRQRLPVVAADLDRPVRRRVADRRNAETLVVRPGRHSRCPCRRRGSLLGLARDQRQGDGLDAGRRRRLPPDDQLADPAGSDQQGSSAALT